jgi:hypothetical protein
MIALMSLVPIGTVQFVIDKLALKIGHTDDRFEALPSKHQHFVTINETAATQSVCDVLGRTMQTVTDTCSIGRSGAVTNVGVVEFAVRTNKGLISSLNGRFHFRRRWHRSHKQRQDHAL